MADQKQGWCYCASSCQSHIKWRTFYRRWLINRDKPVSGYYDAVVLKAEMYREQHERHEKFTVDSTSQLQQAYITFSKSTAAAPSASHDQHSQHKSTPKLKSTFLPLFYRSSAAAGSNNKHAKAERVCTACLVQYMLQQLKQIHVTSCPR